MLEYVALCRYATILYDAILLNHRIVRCYTIPWYSIAYPCVGGGDGVSSLHGGFPRRLVPPGPWATRPLVPSEPWGAKPVVPSGPWYSKPSVPSGPWATRTLVPSGWVEGVHSLISRELAFLCTDVWMDGGKGISILQKVFPFSYKENSTLPVHLKWREWIPLFRKNLPRPVHSEFENNWFSSLKKELAFLFAF